MVNSELSLSITPIISIVNIAYSLKSNRWLEYQMSSGVYEPRVQKTLPKCGQCGRTLGVGFYYACHVCGATYCYAHIPQKCEHLGNKVRPLKVTLRR